MLKLKIYRRRKPNGNFGYYSPITTEFNGKKSTYYLMVNFKKGIEIQEDNAYLLVKTFFLNSYMLGNKPELKIVITDYEKIEQMSQKDIDKYNSEKEDYADFGNIEIPDSEIAF